MKTADTQPRELLSVEVRTESGDAGDLIGAIWFDPETRMPVRAVYRPKGRWALRAGLVGCIRAVPVVPRGSQG